jgi:hypothetical protein
MGKCKACGERLDFAKRGQVRDRRDLTGMQFGHWTVLRQNPERRYSHIYYDCRCVCGTERTVGAMHLRSGKSTNCGCEKVKQFAASKRTHGMTDTRTYQSWCNMKLRCNNPKAVGYQYWGGRGIGYCERWESFDAFLADMGPAPDKMTLDRIDGSKDYGPDNCRWVSHTVQNNNRRSNHRLTFRGRTLTLAEWSRETGISYGALQHRASNGWPVEKTLTQPVRGTK